MKEGKGKYGFLYFSLLCRRAIKEVTLNVLGFIKRKRHTKICTFFKKRSGQDYHFKLPQNKKTPPRNRRNLEHKKKNFFLSRTKERFIRSALKLVINLREYAKNLWVCFFFLIYLVLLGTYYQKTGMGSEGINIDPGYVWRGDTQPAFLLVHTRSVTGN